MWDGSQGTPAVTIDAGGNSTAGNGVHFYPNSFINNEGGVGLYIFDINNVVVNIDGETEDGDQASIIGTVGIQVDDQGEGGAGESITINNFGHVEGTDGAAISINDIGIVNINNHSYASSVGDTDGDLITNADLVNVNNQAGLTAGLGGDGLHIDTVSGAGLLGGSAVMVDNKDGGIFVGADDDGLEVLNVTEGGVAIENQAVFVSEGVWTPGGLFAGLGVGGSGIELDTIVGDVTINNNLTRQAAIDLVNIDSQVSSEGGILDGMLPDGFTSGIFGVGNGVTVNNLTGDLDIWNQNGQIVGAEGDGIALSDIEGLVEIFNSSITVNPSFPGGTIWGGTNGINGSMLMGTFVDNEEGAVFGVQNGVLLTEGDFLEHLNVAGLTWGYYGDAINVSSYDKVGIWNGGDYTLGPYGVWQEGHIIGGDRAIYAAADKVGVINAPGGAIIGDG